jgi:hypothetical protein
MRKKEMIRKRRKGKKGVREGEEKGLKGPTIVAQVYAYVGL